MTQQYKDYSITECCTAADQLIANGAEIHQKFTCDGCGARLAIDEPNVFYTTGTCDKCNHVTDITAKGCNYLVIMPGRGVGSGIVS